MKTAKFVRTIISILILGMMAACQSLTPVATPTPTATFTATSSPTSTPSPRPTATFSPFIKILPTNTPNATETEAYNSMAAVANAFYEQGYIPSPRGIYSQIDDYVDTWAQIDWYQWTNTPSSPKDFVLTAHMAWQSASKTPNPSGCGITFRIQPNKEHYIIFVLSTGYIRFGMRTDKWIDGGFKYYGQPAATGVADFAMTVVGSRVDVFINDKHINTYTGFQGKMLDGKLGYTVLSGTNTGYGTRCAITQGNLWTILP